MSESEYRMIEILRILSVQEKPTGSKLIADELKNKGFNLGERGFWMRRDTPKEGDIPEE